MKRWQILIITGTMILGSILALTGAVQNPADFTGKWYSSSDGTPYLFHNGIIISEKHHLSVNDGEIFSGAYSFGKDKIFLFFVSADGVEQVQELQLVSQASGDVLCTQSDEGMTAVFYRSKAAAKVKKEN